jgi:hypothetical protein
VRHRERGVGGRPPTTRALCSPVAFVVIPVLHLVLVCRALCGGAGVRYPQFVPTRRRGAIQFALRLGRVLGGQKFDEAVTRPLLCVWVAY